ncbi:hypothetical protein C7B65_17855 [Phormidesmis priestleyi ULC007]|uniref:Uncharacterized protein n=1 Tax=Phormidesmis priestleyi ULC007 TaxID=1920490 RepID=A0A2T1DB91_9CYAN|nr:hypothetical protein [Phormidesmis priestleyi]PSB17768.1 hypothetical protein C7B65_17855 [Phormidesmis priestleyi ULC007]PZO48710.1 MAG: hypothetical protein DCF14_16395 [Phormidesmis priestleyi]
MIISELSYLEVATEAHDLEGGLDLSITATQFAQELSVLQTGSSSGPAGTTVLSNAQHVITNSGSFSAILLGA